MSSHLSRIVIVLGVFASIATQSADTAVVEILDLPMIELDAGQTYHVRIHHEAPVGSPTGELITTISFRTYGGPGLAGVRFTLSGASEVDDDVIDLLPDAIAYKSLRLPAWITCDDPDAAECVEDYFLTISGDQVGGSVTVEPSVIIRRDLESTGGAEPVISIELVP